jgi:hypothetical protein
MRSILFTSFMPDKKKRNSWPNQNLITLWSCCILWCVCVCVCVSICLSVCRVIPVLHDHEPQLGSSCMQKPVNSSDQSFPSACCCQFRVKQVNSFLLLQTPRGIMSVWITRSLNVMASLVTCTLILNWGGSVSIFIRLRVGRPGFDSR